MSQSPRAPVRTPWLRICGGALLLGGLTTVGVAWAGAWLEKAYKVPEFSETLVFGRFTARYYLQHGITITRNGVNWEDNGQIAGFNPSWIDARTQGLRAHAPAWSSAWRIDRPSRPPGTWASPGHESTLNEFAAGWPFRALRSECDEPTQDPKTRLAVYPPSRGGITLPCHVIRDGATIFLPRALPYWPIPVGFAADTLVFGVLWGAALGWPALRRALRRRAGKCPKCGYDRRGLPPGGTPCPECGTLWAARVR